MYVSWTTHTVQLTASKVKEVTCQKCRTQYCYALQRTETGTGTTVYNIDEEAAQNRAVGSASGKLQNALSDAFELVPCPNCGEYQPEMVAFLKNAHLKWMAALGGVLIVLAIASLGPWVVSENRIVVVSVALILFAAGVGLIVYRNKARERCNPNESDPEERKKIGRASAFLKTK